MKTTWNDRMAKAVAESDYRPQQIAKALGVSAPTVAAWIGAASIRPAKNITGENLLQVCRLLGVRPEWLMFDEGPMKVERAAKISSEMAQVLAALAEIDAKGGEEREDALYFLNRLLNRGSNMSAKQA
jgi:plasmid maintenance system antidote protein VapI